MIGPKSHVIWSWAAQKTYLECGALHRACKQTQQGLEHTGRHDCHTHHSKAWRVQGTRCQIIRILDFPNVPAHPAIDREDMTGSQLATRLACRKIAMFCCLAGCLICWRTERSWGHTVWAWHLGPGEQGAQHCTIYRRLYSHDIIVSNLYNVNAWSTCVQKLHPCSAMPIKLNSNFELQCPYIYIYIYGHCIYIGLDWIGSRIGSRIQDWIQGPAMYRQTHSQTLVSFNVVVMEMIGK